MLRRRNAMSLVAATAALAPAAAALADDAAQVATPKTIDVNLPGPHESVRAKLNAAARPPLVHDVVGLARTKARLKDARLRPGYREHVSAWSPPRLRAERHDLKREIKRLRAERRRERLAAERRRERLAAERAAAAATTTATTATTTTTTDAPATGADAAATGGSVASGTLQSIAACESGGNPGAVDPSGTYRGKYQFDTQTWQSVGGSGDPAAASEAEQDRRAAMLYSRAGSSPWPVCGR